MQSFDPVRRTPWDRPRAAWYNRWVKITVRLFASYREAVGHSLVEVPLDPDADGPAIWAALVARYPRLASLPAPSGYAVNDEYTPAPGPLRESDEVALIPPVSGGDGRTPTSTDAATHAALITLTDAPISVDGVLAAVADPSAGAVVLFLGVVRDNARGRRVQHLTYEAYDVLARRELERIARDAAARWPITRVAITHRTGRLGIGEASVAIAVSAPHRAAAFDAGRFCIDALKLTVPIWKKEIWDGGAEWIGAEPHAR